MSKVTVVGVNERDGEQIEWFGNAVSIQGVPCVLFRVEYMDGTRAEYYAPSFTIMAHWLEPAEGRVRSVRYCSV